MRNRKKRARSEPGSTKQPQSKYSNNPPDFANLASLYPSFKPFVFFSDLIEIRDSKLLPQRSSVPEVENRENEKTIPEAAETSAMVQSDYPVYDNKSYTEPAVLLGVVKENETFDFCMSNPPFFETFEESGLNPKTACGGTPEEMVCNGGEQAFVSRIIEDSAVLRQRFRWYTSMLGKKATLKLLISKLWEVGVTIVKTTEFVQGHTLGTRLGIKWQYSAVDVLQSVEEFFKSCGASCKLSSSTFSVDIVASNDQCNIILKNVTTDVVSARSHIHEKQSLVGSTLQVPEDNLSFRILVLHQMPGTLLIKGSLQQKDIPVKYAYAGAGLFSIVFGSLEENMKSKFCQ
ncbi:hypothetical protein CARUB_v10023555mg [Capsella rubella]|uniref:Uncharacterized protein n=1 Tax=Capsella rubella TaxID=81985 RepID=R0HQ65_9BRAS|nr:hypothetical protein CARUB_v10023555mg [Capsella rubella]